MAHINKVMRSFNNSDAARCVDIFMRPDGSFGFEEYRRDREDARGWFPIGFFAGEIYANEQAALRSALEQVVWLGDAIASL